MGSPTRPQPQAPDGSAPTGPQRQAPDGIAFQVSDTCLGSFLTPILTYVSEPDRFFAAPYHFPTQSYNACREMPFLDVDYFDPDSNSNTVGTLSHATSKCKTKTQIHRKTETKWEHATAKTANISRSAMRRAMRATNRKTKVRTEPLEQT